MNRKKYFLINKKTTLFIFILWVFFPAGYFSVIPGMSRAVNLATYIISLTFVIFSLFHLRRTQDVLQLILIIVFYLELTVVTLFAEGNVMSSVLYSLPVIALCMLYTFISNDLKIRMIRSLFWIHFIFAAINLATVVLFPNGFYTYQGASQLEAYFFLGHNNVAGRFLLPLVAYALLDDYYYQNGVGWKSYFSAILSFVTVCLTWSNTAMVGLGIVLLYVLLNKKVRLPKFITMKTCVVLAFVAFFFLVIENNFGIFGLIIENIFHKDLTLSSRTQIWEAMLINIINKPFFGYGYGVSVWSFASMGGLEPSSAHNYFLDLLFRGGLVHLVIQILIVLNAGRYIDKKRNGICNAMLVVFIAYFVMWEVEPFINSGFRDMMLLFVIAYDLKFLYTPEPHRNSNRLRA